MLGLIIPKSSATKIEPLNSQSYSDYLWKDYQARQVQVERKQWGEILSNLDAVEEQLLRHLNLHPKDRHILLIEGVAISTPVGSQVLKQTNSGVWVKGGTLYRARMSGVYAWLSQVMGYMEVIQTTSLVETATALVSMEDSDSRENHGTFHRHIKNSTFNPNPMVTQLMGVAPGLGDKRATSLINKFGTTWRAISASPSEWAQIDGIGLPLAKSVLARIGRDDV